MHPVFDAEKFEGQVFDLGMVALGVWRDRHAGESISALTFSLDPGNGDVAVSLDTAENGQRQAAEQARLAAKHLSAMRMDSRFEPAWIRARLRRENLRAISFCMSCYAYPGVAAFCSDDLLAYYDSAVRDDGTDDPPDLSDVLFDRVCRSTDRLAASIEFKSLSAATPFRFGIQDREADLSLTVLKMVF